MKNIKKLIKGLYVLVNYEYDFMDTKEEVVNYILNLLEECDLLKEYDL